MPAVTSPPSDSAEVRSGPLAFLEDLFSLAGRVAVVTGGTSGLGAETARAFARAGATVVVGGRSEERGAAVIESIAAGGGRAEFAALEVTQEVEVEALARRVVDELGRVDILVNSAGVFNMTPSVELDLENWSRQLAVNLTGTFLACRAFGRGMIERGHGKIINLASTDSFVGVPGEAAYCASKGGVVQLTRVLGAEWIKHGVNVNAVALCDFRTPLIEPFLDDPEYREWVTGAIPIGRVGEPHELVGAMIYLASEASTMVVGHTLVIDGGRTIV